MRYSVEGISVIDGSVCWARAVHAGTEESARSTAKDLYATIYGKEKADLVEFHVKEQPIIDTDWMSKD